MQAAPRVSIWPEDLADIDDMIGKWADWCDADGERLDALDGETVAVAPVAAVANMGDESRTFVAVADARDVPHVSPA